jgi:hypothetical protein
MDRIDPIHLFHPLRRFDIEVDDYRLIVAAHQHAFERCVAGTIDLLMRHVGMTLTPSMRQSRCGESVIIAP